MNIAVLTLPYRYRCFSTALMTLDGWTDSSGDNHYPTVAAERLDIDDFLSGRDHLYLDLYYHDDAREVPGSAAEAHPEKEPSFLARRKLIDASMRASTVYLRVDDLVVIDETGDLLPARSRTDGEIEGPDEECDPYWDEPREDPDSDEFV